MITRRWHIVITAVICLCFVLLGGVAARQPANADIQDTWISSEAFPDPVFREYITKNYDKNQDNILQDSENEKIHSLDFTEYELKKVKSMYGVQMLRYLGSVTLGRENRGIEDFDRLQYNNELTSLHIDNTFDELDVSGFAHLNYLICSSSTASYKTLGNSLTKLNVEGCTRLKEIDCYGNKLKEVTGLNTCSSLVKANFQSNNISELDVSGLEYIEYINALDNPLKSFKCSGCPALKTLSVGGEFSSYEEVDGRYQTVYYTDTISSLDLSGCTSLDSLTVHCHYLTDINLRDCTELRDLLISKYFSPEFPAMNSLDLSNNSKLKYATIDYCGLKTLDVSSCTGLNILDVRGNKLSELNVSNLPKLYQLNIAENNISSIDVSKCQYLSDVIRNTTFDKSTDYFSDSSYPMTKEVDGVSFETTDFVFLQRDLYTEVVFDGGVVPASGSAPSDDDQVQPGKTYTVSGSRFKVLTKAGDSSAGTVAFTKVRNVKSVTVPKTVKIEGKTYKVTKITANAFKGSKIRTVTIGANVKSIAANAFKGSKATKVVMQTKLLKKTTVKKCFAGSKVKLVQVKVGKSSVNKKYVKSYKKIFTKKIVGAKVTVK